MRKFFYILFTSLFIIGVILFIDEISYNPLKKEDFKILFHNYESGFKKQCDIDFLGWNSKGEFFDFYSYKTNTSIKENNFIGYPNFDFKWKNVDASDESVYSRWKKTPIDTISASKLKELLFLEDYDKYECSKLFKKQLTEQGNYYSYYYVNELEQYLFLITLEKKQLYYLRKRGF